MRLEAGVIVTIGFANDARRGSFAIDSGLTEFLSADTRALVRSSLTHYVVNEFMKGPSRGKYIDSLSCIIRTKIDRKIEEELRTQ